MSQDDYSIAQLRANYEGTPLGASLEYVLAQDHTTRLAAVQRAVDFACNQLEQHKHKKQGNDGCGLSEDELTLEICEMLSMGGFQATHDEDVGGHCDIVIRGKDLFLWLAEAKKHDSYDWLDKGFQQLSTRYSTGKNGQDNGEVLIYCYVRDAKAMLDKWRSELQERNPPVKTSTSHNGDQLIFHSIHKHASTGLDFFVRHKAVALYWSPKDREPFKACSTSA